MSRSFIVLNILLFTLSIPLTAQGIFQEKNDFTRQDSLRGMITAERSWWDLNYYHLDIKVDPKNKSIKGSNTVGYKVLKSHKLMQIDLQEPMRITSVKQNNKSLDFSREGNAYFIKLKRKQKLFRVSRFRR